MGGFRVCVCGGGGGGPRDQNSLPLILADPHATRGISDRATQPSYMRDEVLWT